MEKALGLHRVEKGVREKCTETTWKRLGFNEMDTLDYRRRMAERDLTR
jgi:hypothetical protein